MEAEIKALIDRLQPGEMLEWDFDTNDEMDLLLMRVRDGGPRKRIETIRLPYEASDIASRVIEQLVASGKLDPGPYCSTWVRPFLPEVAK
jgi:hypothetical protein